MIKKIKKFLGKEDAKLKIKQIDNNIVNINSHILFCKNKYNNIRENIFFIKKLQLRFICEKI